MNPADWPEAEFRSDPFPFWDLLRENYPVWRHPASGLFLITRYRDVVDVFSDSERWSNRYYAKSLGAVFGPTMLQMDGHDHVVRRTIVAPEVVGKRLGGYRDLIERNAIELVDHLRRKRSADLVADFTTWLPVNVIVDMLGMPKDGLPLFHGWYQAMMAGLTHLDPAARQRGIDAHRALAAYTEPIIAHRMMHPGDDFISKILHAECDGERLSLVEVQAFISLMLTAGGETTDKALANLWANLLTNPEQLELVRRDPTNFDPAFSETMRHSFPVLSQIRTAVVDVEMCGVGIPAGSVVSISIGSANNDPDVFRDPRRFDLRRTDLWLAKELRKGYDDGERFGHLGFGLGKHFCLGYEMARAEAVIGSQVLLEALPDIHLVPGVALDMVVTGATRSVQAMPIEFTPV
jgi:cytochrome P450